MLCSHLSTATEVEVTDMTEPPTPEPDEGEKPATPATPKRGAFPVRPADVERATPYVPAEPPAPEDADPPAGDE